MLKKGYTTIDEFRENIMKILTYIYNESKSYIS